MSVPHPIPYQGSKRGLARNILALFPPDAGTLVEPFAGSAAVTLAAACTSKAIRFALNDLNAPLMALWREIVERPQQLADAYERLWRAQTGQERAFYDEVRDAFNARHRPEHLLYLLARCVKASVRYNTVGEFNQSPDNRRRGAAPDTMRAHIRGAAELLCGRVAFSSHDYRDVLRELDGSEVVYMDPPYQGVSGERDRRYIRGLDPRCFEQALAELNERGIRYIVSYDGRTGDKAFGRTLPPSLALTHIEVHAGRSSQATLLGRAHDTVESLYLSPVLAREVDRITPARVGPKHEQPSLFEAMA